MDTKSEVVRGKYNGNMMSVLAYANGFTLWHYKSKYGDHVPGFNFFGEASDMLEVGDMIIADGNFFVVVIVDKKEHLVSIKRSA